MVHIKEEELKKKRKQNPFISMLTILQLFCHSGDCALSLSQCFLSNICMLSVHFPLHWPGQARDEDTDFRSRQRRSGLGLAYRDWSNLRESVTKVKIKPKNLGIISQMLKKTDFQVQGDMLTTQDNKHFNYFK